MRKAFTIILSGIAFCFSLLAQPCFSQPANYNYDYDSLSNQLPLKKTDNAKINLLVLLVDISPEFSRRPADNTISYLEQLIALNKKIHTINIDPYIQMHESYLQWKDGDFENALISFKKTIDLFDKEKKVIASRLTEIRTLYNVLNRQEERLEYFQQKLNYYLLNGPVENTAACYHGIAGYYNYKADYNLAINNYLKAQAIFKTFWGYFYRNELSVIGNCYEKWGNREKAYQYMQEAMPLHKANRDSTNIPFASDVLIRLSLGENKYTDALAYINEAIVFTNKYANDPAYIILQGYRAATYLAMDKPTLAYPYLTEVKKLTDSFHFQLSGNDGDLESDFGFYKYYQAVNDPANAVIYLRSAYAKSLAEKANTLQLKYLKELASFYEKQDPSLSMDYINKYFGLEDSLVRGNEKFKVAQYEIEQKELEQTKNIAALKQEKAIQQATITQRNTILWISLIALFLIVVSMIFLYRQFLNNRKTLGSLRKTQRQLIMAEKMASLGELTAGIAHEIQNPLNFVNNFSEINNELIDEMNAEINKGDMDEAKAIANDLKQNLEKINHHGKRADAIVKGMLQHSSKGSGQKEQTDINALCDEYLRLSYHGLRAKDKSFNATLKTNYDNNIGSISIIPQDIGRVVLNLITNAFYVVDEKKKQQSEGYEPIVSISTKKINNNIEITVSDNGNGIPKNIIDKIFQPFFTTKPTGQGTGLGLSLSYDIIKAHGGEIKVETKEGEETAFIIQLPVNK